MMVGQFDEFSGKMRNSDGREAWEGGRDAIADLREESEHNLASIVIEPGAGHFAWSDRNAEYSALFIEKAAQACIWGTWPVDEKKSVILKKIDPSDGWLTDLSINVSSTFKPASSDKYPGDGTKAAWHFDKEIAEAAMACHEGIFGKKDQFIKWNDPYSVDAGTRFFFTRLKWVGDGQTFEVHPVYADSYPSQHDGKGPHWPRAGEPVGHSTAPILVKPVSGPVVSKGPNTFRMQYDNLAPATGTARVTFMAYSAGDKDYRYTELVGMMPRGFSGLKKGRDQTITFPPIDTHKVKSSWVDLNATSDSGLPVEYYVAYGPARVEGGKLKISELPARAVFPVSVKVVAYQFGSGVEPLVKTAEPVEQTLQVMNH